MMRCYNQQHRFYCGVDLHARTLYLCILDQQGAIVFHQNLPADANAFRRAVAPYRDGLVVAAECMFAWYWLADLCQAEGIPFVLGHALYMKAIHGTKTKNDKLDSHKIVLLLRGGNLPVAYVYPKGMRETRDLLRRRSFLVRQRSHLIAHIQNEASQYNLPAFAKRLCHSCEERGKAARDRSRRSVWCCCPQPPIGSISLRRGANACLSIRIGPDVTKRNNLQNSGVRLLTRGAIDEMGSA
jgi:hypothetical protein